MFTDSQAMTVTRDRAVEVIRHAMWGDPTPATPDRVGLETEMFVVERDQGGPGRRTPLFGDGSIIEILKEAIPEGHGTAGGNPIVQLGRDGVLTFEPGAQIEHATAPFPSGSAAITNALATRSRLATIVNRRGLALVSCGIDRWHDARSIPQQLPGGRYRAMATYFDTRSTVGPSMMRNSASIQVSLDAGRPGTRERRVAVAQLLSPLMTASFSTSPSPTHVSERGRVWQAIDPTRTGFPSSAAPRDLEHEMIAMALDADVMVFWHSDTDATPGAPGFSLRDWLRDGHPDHGWPTDRDVAYHLTTLFPEVRVRGGVIELRAVDALPDRWLAAAVVLVTGAIYDDVARETLLDLLAGYSADLPRLWQDAARTGNADPRMCALAVEAWSIALAGARRLPHGFDETDLATASRFIDTFTARGRAPADDLRDMDPASAFEFCAVPAPLPVTSHGKAT